MKKFLSTIIAVAATVAFCGMAVCAAPSPSNVGAVSEVVGAKDASGASIEIVALPTDAKEPTKTAMQSAAASETAKEVVNSENADVIGLVDLEKISEGEVTFPVDVTVKVANVTPGTKLAVFHNPNSDGATWVEEKSSCGNGTVTIYGLTSLSPFAFVADTTTLAGTANVTAAGTSPKTGEAPVVPVAMAVAAGAALCSVFVSKKRV